MAPPEQACTPSLFKAATKQGQFERNSYWLESARYVVLNPLRARIVKLLKTGLGARIAIIPMSAYCTLIEIILGLPGSALGSSTRNTPFL